MNTSEKAEDLILYYEKQVKRLNRELFYFTNHSIFAYKNFIQKQKTISKITA